MATGPEGSDYAEFGERYRTLLAASGVDLQLVTTAGAVENLARLGDPRSDVSVAFTVSGLPGVRTAGLESLGTVAFEPVWLFERYATGGLAIEAIASKRIAVGPEGSGSRPMALELLRLFGADLASFNFLPLEPEKAAERLLRGEVDGLMLTASWDSPVVRRLAASPDVSLRSVRRADAFVALDPYLTKVVLPQGVADLRANRPPEDVLLVAPKASLVIRSSLHPAVQYLLLDAATKIHSGPGVFHRAGTFPAAEAIDVPLSEQAARYHIAGRPFLQRYLPYWLWVLAEKLLVILAPLLAVLYPLLSLGPRAWGALMQRRILVLYGELKVIETEIGVPGGAPTAQLLARLEALAGRAAQLRVPLPYTQMLFILKEHVRLVRQRLSDRA